MGEVSDRRAANSARRDDLGRASTGQPEGGTLSAERSALIARPSLILVGLPGVGKSTIGAAVAARLGWPFVDFDVEIERREGMSVTELFRTRGEAYFRGCERRLGEELAGRGGMVLAPGGGWIVQPGQVALLRPPGRIIYLAASPAAVAARLGAGRASRPLLAGGDVVDRLARLLADREPAYRTADLVVDTELIDEQEVICRVLALAGASGAR
ncbi:MAG TPA: shikimate kinase [Gemmatimonadaceae bacterium]|nr:shikimate kinase [Gemmatimonadaceae bacterium]